MWIRWFRTGPPADGEVGFEGDELVARLDGLHRLGRIEGRPAGSRDDAAAAAAVALTFGAGPTAVTAGLSSFRPGPHRGEVVASVDGVRFIDNSKATNVHAAAAAIDAAGPVVLIAGGRAKGADLSPLREHAVAVRAVIAIGEAADDIVEVFDGVAPASIADSIEDAVRDAFAAARPGDAVLLAPACASWDQFRSYAERGDRFAAAARSSARRRGPWLTARSPGGARSPRLSRGSHLRLVRPDEVLSPPRPRPPWPAGTSRSCSFRRGS